MIVGCVKNNDVKISKVDEFTREMELYRAITKAIPLHAFRQSPVSYYSGLRRKSHILLGGKNILIY